MQKFCLGLDGIRRAGKPVGEKIIGGKADQAAGLAHDNAGSHFPCQFVQ